MNRFSAILAAVLVAVVSPWAATRQSADQTVAPADARQALAETYRDLADGESGLTVLDLQRRVAENTPSEENDRETGGDAEVWGFGGLGAKHSTCRSLQDAPASTLDKTLPSILRSTVAAPRAVASGAGQEFIAPPPRWRHTFHAGSNDPPGNARFWERVALGKTALAQSINKTPIERHRSDGRVVEELTT